MKFFQNKIWGIVFIAAAIMSIQGCRLDNCLPEPLTPFEIIVLTDIHVRTPGNPDALFYDGQRNSANLMLAIFSGHWHLWREYTLFDTIPVYQAGAIGGYWSSKENIGVIRIDPFFKTVSLRRHSAM